MKRYIKSTSEPFIDPSMFEGTPFHCDTGTSEYNDYLDPDNLKYKQQAKNRTGKIVMMTPNEYFEQCSKYGFPAEVSIENIISGRRADTESLTWLENYLDSGNKFDLPYINYASRTQEGLHRMMVAGDRYGWDTKFPVLVVTAYDQDVERRNQMFRDYCDFRDHYFDKICDTAVYDELSNWTGLPDNSVETDIMLDILKDRIIECAKTYDPAEEFDIDVELQLDDDGSQHILNIYITQFDEYDTSDRYEGCQLILEDYISPSDTSQLDDLSDTDSILDDIDIADILFGDDTN